jgi:hemerythrin-like domain-containing protein
MKSVERLMAEHELIERGLVLFEKAVGRINAGQPLLEDFPAWAARFFQPFADKCHHGKEEGVFFPVLKQRGGTLQEALSSDGELDALRIKYPSPRNPERHEL